MKGTRRIRNTKIKLKSKTAHSKTWRPTQRFLSTGEGTVWNPFLNKHETLRWYYAQIPTPGFKGVALVCYLKCDSELTLGFGESVHLMGAQISSLAEAWERLWMRKIYRQFGNRFRKVRTSSSNGFAAGSSVKDAIRRSRQELIDREIFLRCWQSMSGWKFHSPKSKISKRLIRQLCEVGWRIDFYKAHAKNLGTTLAILARHQKKGIIFDTNYLVRGQRISKSEEKLLRFLFREYALRKLKSVDRKWKLPKKGVPNDHAIFYSVVKNQSAFGFLANAHSSLPEEMSSPKEIITEVLIPVTDFPAVAVSYHPRWIILNWGTQSISGKNPWPHAPPKTKTGTRFPEPPHSLESVLIRSELELKLKLAQDRKLAVSVGVVAGRVACRSVDDVQLVSHARVDEPVVTHRYAGKGVGLSSHV